MSHTDDTLDSRTRNGLRRRRRPCEGGRGWSKVAGPHRTFGGPLVPPPPQTKGTIVGKKTKSPRREVVRSSAGASVVYPPFLGSFA